MRAGGGGTSIHYQIHSVGLLFTTFPLNGYFEGSGICFWAFLGMFWVIFLYIWGDLSYITSHLIELQKYSAPKPHNISGSVPPSPGKPKTVVMFY